MTRICTDKYKRIREDLSAIFLEDQRNPRHQRSIIFLVLAQIGFYNSTKNYFLLRIFDFLFFFTFEYELVT